MRCGLAGPVLLLPLSSAVRTRRSECRSPAACTRILPPEGEYSGGVQQLCPLGLGRPRPRPVNGARLSRQAPELILCEATADLWIVGCRGNQQGPWRKRMSYSYRKALQLQQWRGRLPVVAWFLRCCPRPCDSVGRSLRSADAQQRSSAAAQQRSSAAAQDGVKGWVPSLPRARCGYSAATDGFLTCGPISRRISADVSSSGLCQDPQQLQQCPCEGRGTNKINNDREP